MAPGSQAVRKTREARRKNRQCPWGDFELRMNANVFVFSLSGSLSVAWRSVLRILSKLPASLQNAIFFLAKPGAEAG